MVNTLPRAHVVNLATIPASGDDHPDLKNYRTSDESLEETSEPSEPQSRKAKRKHRKQESRNDTSASPELENNQPTTSTTQLDDEEESDILTDESARLSRKEKRKLKKQHKTTEPPTSTTPSKPPNNPPKSRKIDQSANLALSIPSSLSSPSMTTPKYFPLLVCSLGNPGPQYANTLHSAGHTILNHIRDRGLYHPFERGMSGQVAKPNTTRFRYHILKGFQKDGTRALIDGEDDFTLWKSTKLMNISGPSVNTAWREFSAQQRNRGLEGRLVVVHDELEAQLGKVSIKDGTASPRGHNGLKSVQASLGGNKWWRIGVGIGRPESRDASVVSKYVLRKMTYSEENAMDKAAINVLYALRKIADGSA